MKTALAAAAAFLLGPSVLLLGAGAVLNPAAKAACSVGGGLVVTNIPDTLEAETADGGKVVLSRAQLGRAATIVAVGSSVPGTDRDAVVVALMAALTESSLRMLSNKAAWPESADYDNDGDGSDHDSLGLFQMRPSTGWGTVEELMDPAYQARAFMGGPTGPNHPSPRGLLDIPGWKAMPKGDAAQAVEVSAYPDRYRKWEPVAAKILQTLTAPNPGGTPPPDPVGSGPVVFPLPAGTWVKTSDFGWRVHPIHGTRRFHAGTDYSAPDGTPILAAADGVVRFAGPAQGYGNAVVIDHQTADGGTVSSLYGHMWDGHLYVKPGDHVSAGQRIADVGSNGNSTGPHLHFEIHPGGVKADAIDPHAWLAANGAAELENAAAGPSGGGVWAASLGGCV
ncbi:MAG: M23 family metallopeptidase [Bifidobacteriaceae bacterium]|nr:M23 family metallopeptidase [Bifidobacteriaceae bacterium]